MRSLSTQDNEFVRECLDPSARSVAIRRAERHRSWCLGAGALLLLVMAAVRIAAGVWDPILLIGMCVLVGIAVVANAATSEIRLLKLTDAIRAGMAARDPA